MLSTLRNAWKVPDLRKRILYTILLVAIFRIGNFIPVPGIDTAQLQGMNKEGSLINFYDLIAGGAFSRFSIFALAVSPYINASIIMQLLTMAVPQLEQLSKEGEEGRKKIQNATRYLAIPLSIFMAYGVVVLAMNSGSVKDTSTLGILMLIVPLISGATFLMWLGDQITVKGIGNGMSIIIFVNMISRFPMMVYQVISLKKTEEIDIIGISLFIVIGAAMIISVVIMTLAERRIPVQYAGKAVGNKTYKGQSTHIPIGISGSAVIAIIFALSVLQFPPTIAQFFPNSGFATFINKYSIFKPDSGYYMLVYAIFVIFFTWFYSQVTFKPDEMAENMHKSAGFIPGIRPGEPTAKFIERVLDRISVLGGTFAALIAIFPLVIDAYTPFKGIEFGGTMLLILVGVSLDTMRQIESQLVMRHYQGFLK